MPLHRALAVALLTATCFAFTPAQAQQESDAAPFSAEEFLASLEPQHGEIQLPGGIATLNLPDSFYYLSPSDAERVLSEAWGNPPGGDYLGMLVPSAYHVLQNESWAVIVSYEEDGHVKDDDASDMDYDALLKQMREDTKANSAQRVEAGYEAIELIGWATRPHYDATEKKMYWAKELKFGDGSGVNTLNYSVRILGRKGVLVLNMVASMPQLAEVEQATPTVLAMTNFAPGSRYSDFDPELDEVAAYGIGALIAGKLAAKAGLLAKLGIVLIALKKFWFVLVIAAWIGIKRLLGRRSAKT